MSGRGTRQNPTHGSANIPNDVTFMSQSADARQEMIRNMLNACSNRHDASCPVCVSLKRKLEPSTEAVTHQPPSIEQEQTKLVRQYFPLSVATSDTRDLLEPNISTNISQQAVNDDSTAIGASIGTEFVMVASRGLRHSDSSDLATKQGVENRALNYGLHSLIHDIELEPGRNHRAVFENLEQSQLHSLLAQITCKDTLFKESESNSRLLRIEQELNDLMSREDASRAVFDSRHGSVSLARGVSKKPNH